MLNYITLGSNNLARSVAFYDVRWLFMMLCWPRLA